MCRQIFIIMNDDAQFLGVLWKEITNLKKKPKNNIGEDVVGERTSIPLNKIKLISLFGLC